MGDLDDPRIRKMAIDAMASIICSSSVFLGDELGVWRRLKTAGFTLESIAVLLPDVRREVLRRRQLSLRPLGRRP